MEEIFPFNFSLQNTTNQTKSKIEFLLSAHFKYYPHISFHHPFFKHKFLQTQPYLERGSGYMKRFSLSSSSQNNVEKKGWILSAWINNFRSYSLNNQPSYQYHKDPVLHKWSVHLWRSNRVVPPLAHQLAATLFIRPTFKILLPPTTKSVFCKKRPLKATYL